ncbi:MAG TPA: RtcB family protein, partial [Thermoanaerobaculia bacterium]
METAVSELPSVRLSPVLVGIPATARADMRVPARVWADEVLWEQIRRDRTLWQLVNVATLPGIVGYAQAMPDAHEGYGFPVGGVAAFRAEAEGVISPGGVGYDINCGVRLLASELDAAEVGPRIESIVHDLMRTIPSGIGRRGRVSLSDRDLEGVLADGAAHHLRRGQALPEDLETTEAGGSFAEADPAQVSERARERGRGQL